jgi:hypothetical protein
MLGIDLVELAIRLIAGGVRKMAVPTRVVARPNPVRVVATKTAYSTWAREKGLENDDTIRGYRGRLERHDVVVRPGLDGSAPIGVEIEVTIDHEQKTSTLLSSKDAGTTTLEKGLAALLDEALELRSVALFPGGVRLRFVALTPPESVEHAVRATVTAIAHARMPGGSSAYR